MSAINGMRIEKTANGWTVNGQQVGFARDGVTLQTGSVVNGYEPIVTLSAEQIAEVTAEYEALRQARFAAARTPNTARTRARATGYTAQGFDGRGNRVQDGPEWTWR